MSLKNELANSIKLGSSPTSVTRGAYVRASEHYLSIGTAAYKDLLPVQKAYGFAMYLNKSKGTLILELYKAVDHPNRVRSYSRAVGVCVPGIRAFLRANGVSGLAPGSEYKVLSREYVKETESVLLEIKL